MERGKLPEIPVPAWPQTATARLTNHPLSNREFLEVPFRSLFAFVQPSLRPFWIHSPSLRGTMRPPRGWRRTARGRGLWARLPRGPKRASRRRRNVFIRMFHPSHRKSAPTLASRRTRRRRRYLNTVDSQGLREQSFLKNSSLATEHTRCPAQEFYLRLASPLLGEAEHRQVAGLPQ